MSDEIKVVHRSDGGYERKMRELMLKQMHEAYKQMQFAEKAPTMEVDMWVCPLCGGFTCGDVHKPEPTILGSPGKPGPRLVPAPPNTACNLCQMISQHYPILFQWISRVMAHHQFEAHYMDDNGNVIRKVVHT